MATSFLTQWFSDHMIKATCWTLIHSLWIGLIIAALAGLVVAFTKKATSRARYQLLCGVLLLFVLSTAFTFYLELGSENGNLNFAHHITKISVTNDMAGQIKAGPAEANIANRSVVFLNQQIGWIFLVWLICFAIKSVKMMGGLFYIHRIRTQKVHLIDEEWRDKVLLFSKKLGISQKVTLLQSELVKVPVTIGVLKPVILLPLGLLLQLPAGQIDTILWHELAHIYRRDYLVNILQEIVEVVFFFNPALLWLSALIREEREACCDDLVLANVSQKGNYLQALLSFHEYADVSVKQAMALGLGRNQLKNRLKRMVNLENKRLSIVEKVILLSGIVVLSLLSFIPKANSEIQHTAIFLKKNILAIMIKANKDDRPQITTERPKLKSLITNHQIDDKIIVQPLKDSLATDTSVKLTSISFMHTDADSAIRVIRAKDDVGNQYYLKMINNQLTFMQINGKTIKSEDLPKYQHLAEGINRSAENLRLVKYQNIARLKALRDENRNREMNADDEVQMMKLRRMSSLDRNDSVKLKDIKVKYEKTPKMTIKLRKDLVLYKDTNITKAEMRNQIYVMKVNGVDKIALKRAIDAKMALKMVKVEKKNDSLRKVRDSVMIKRRAFYKKNDSVYFRRKEAEQQVVKAEMKGIINDLINANVVKDKNSLSWFGLTETELIVNGLKQPEEIQKKLAEKYIRNPRFGFYYGPVQMYGMGYFYGKNDL
ncbi:M56 family metallopeptidase [Mucilaginibacter sp. X4EP1]|uniref:M56 family metallopeptidase n=1 Tax=Mucilaginibacter sp. X4EP1 TaxID=2723092 RepID=UPI002168D040|nr:M56 family metallopeptidase [Mucilaginibacter sp. X4EP1]MCS3814240.1 beta-lactamase regulating signal transducer with metallopeptidase domain [Mucilaginibacter sp. X4EP1]